MRYGLVGMALAIVLCVQPALSASAAPRVVVSIKPLHSLVAGVMKGVGEPYLLMKGAASPHTFSLKPSDARELERARVIFWVGDILSPGLERPLEVLPKKAEVIALAEVKGLGVRKLKLREGGLWEGHEIRHHGDENREEARKEAMGDHHMDKNKDEKHHDEEKRKEDKHGPVTHEHFDSHIWLDPLSARKWVSAIVHELEEVDPGNGKKYEANAKNLKARLYDLHTELDRILDPVRNAPYIVFHDAYQYLEKRYGLNAIGSIAVSPEKKPGTARLVEIRKKIRGLKSICVFTEPQFQPKLVQTVIRGTAARIGVLDPLGASVPAGEDAYFTLMRAMAKSLKTCLSRK